MKKGYPRTRFTIIDRTNIPEIETDVNTSPSMPLAMALYTSDKGPEDWQIITRLANFTNMVGPISYAKHGQPQLTVAEILRSGGAVFGKRLVAEDATYANITIYASIILTGQTICVYYTAESCTPAGEDTTTRDFDKICEWAYSENSIGTDGAAYYTGKYDEDLKKYRTNSLRLSAKKNAEEENKDNPYYQYDGVMPDDEITNTPLIIKNIPLFTVAAIGRGESKLYFRFSPEYTTSKTSTYFNYTFEVLEDQERIESVVVTLNPTILVDGVAQFVNPKIQATSRQVKIRAYEDGLKVLSQALSCAEACELKPSTGEAIGNVYNAVDFINSDILNGMTSRGRVLGNVLTKETVRYKKKMDKTSTTAEDDETLWNAKRDETLWNDGRESLGIAEDEAISICSDIGVPLLNGSYGKFTDSPMKINTKKKTEGEDKDDLDPYCDHSEYSKAYIEVLLKELGAADVVDPTDESQIADGSLQADSVIYDLDAVKPDFIADCAYPTDVKNAIIRLVDYREDMIFFADLGKVYTSVTDIVEAANEIEESKFTALYHNFFDMYDPYTARVITVTVPFLLAKRMVNHINNGVGRPFSGMRNSITFPEIINRSLNLIPVKIPAGDQKQDLIDANVNYISYYDGVPVMETEYVHHSAYTQLSYLHNIMAIQEVIKDIRSHCPSIRYAFIDGSDLQRYIDDTNAILNKYASSFASISMQYMADPAWEANNIFYATITVRFKNFIQEEYFRVIAID
jgi:hypothetical protein